LRRALHDEVDPILWTKKGHSLATVSPAFLTDNSVDLASSSRWRYRPRAG
jgi:hypothetical protein